MLNAQHRWGDRKWVARKTHNNTVPWENFWLLSWTDVKILRNQNPTIYQCKVQLYNTFENIPSFIASCSFTEDSRLNEWTLIYTPLTNRRLNRMTSEMELNVYMQWRCNRHYFDNNGFCNRSCFRYCREYHHIFYFIIVYFMNSHQ